MLKRWSKPNGYRQVLAISLPLVASMGSITLMQFTDRVFLANYSVDSIAAAMPAGIASFTFIAFFMGVATYTNAFVAQYTGARAFERVGAAVWQGIWFSIFSSCFLASLYFISKPLFSAIGHSPHIQALEVDYFNILTLGAGLVVASSAMACFYTGRGLTWTVMLVNMAGAAVNIPLDYCLINGIGPFPEMGIKGAAIATVAASADDCSSLDSAHFQREEPQKFRNLDQPEIGQGPLQTAHAIRPSQRDTVLPGDFRVHLFYPDAGPSREPGTGRLQHRPVH